MSQTPNYDRLPVDFRIAHERELHKDLYKDDALAVDAIASDNAKENYLTELRARNDAHPSGHALDKARETLATMADLVGMEFLDDYLHHGNNGSARPAPGRSVKAIVEQGHGKAKTGGNRGIIKLS